MATWNYWPCAKCGAVVLLGDPEESPCPSGGRHSFDLDRLRPRNRPRGSPVTEIDLLGDGRGKTFRDTLRTYSNYREFERAARSKGLEICGDKDPPSIPQAGKAAKPKPRAKEFLEFCVRHGLHKSSEGYRKAVEAFKKEKGKNSA